MMNAILTYLATLVPLAFLDGIWILFAAKKFYAAQLGFLLSKTVQIVPIALFYPLYAFAILLLVVKPALVSGSWVEALWRGALLGLAAYGTYDLTNQATISGWPTIVTLVDIVWGMSVTALTSACAYFFMTRFS
jgi:uncharacterized membrane protein